MKNKTLMAVSKWFLIAILASGNFLAYMINGTTINLILVIVIIVYGMYEFFISLSGNNLNLNFKLYLFFFYTLSNISLLLGLRALLSDQFQTVIICLLFLIGDIALILYMLHKITSRE